MDREETAKIRKGSKGVTTVGQFFHRGQLCHEFFIFFLLKQVAKFESTGQGKKWHTATTTGYFSPYICILHMVNNSTHWEKKKTLYGCRERNDAFRISAGLLRAVVLIGRVKWSEFYSALQKKNEVNVNKVTTSCNGRKRKQRAASSEIGNPWRETHTGSVSWDFSPPEHLNCERTSQLVENLA